MMRGRQRGQRWEGWPGLLLLLVGGRLLIRLPRLLLLRVPRLLGGSRMLLLLWRRCWRPRLVGCRITVLLGVLLRPWLLLRR